MSKTIFTFALLFCVIFAKQGDDVCAEDEIEDCDGICCPEGWVDDGWCDGADAAWGCHFDCEEHDFDGGDCDSMGLDCDGVSCDLNWVDDGWCDGEDAEWGCNFDCEEFDFDGGDCDEEVDEDAGADTVDDVDQDAEDGELAVITESEEEGEWEVPALIEDCDGNECPEDYVGDDYCDGEDLAYGCNFMCEEFDFDGGDCEDDSELEEGEDLTAEDQTAEMTLIAQNDGVSNSYDPAVDGACYPWQVLDCNGKCCQSSWIGDGGCDGEDAKYGCNFDCEEHNNDGGDC